MLKVFIVILNFNGRKDTLDCLESVGQLSTDSYQLKIVVVDNASTEDIGEIKNVDKLIKNPRNLGFAGGNNVGIKYALDNGADFVLLLNNDTTVDKNLVVHLIEVAENYKDTGILSPKIYFAPGYEFHKDRYKSSDRGKVIWYAGGEIDWNNVYCKNIGADEVDHGQYDRVGDLDFATGACMFLRREALKEVGLFDEKYFMYLEDADLSLRMRKKGWKVVYAPKAHLWHKVAQSSRIGSELNDYYIARNRLLFGMRYAPLRAKFALLRQSVKLLFGGRAWERRGILDFYLGRFGRGSWQ